MMKRKQNQRRSRSGFASLFGSVRGSASFWRRLSVLFLFVSTSAIGQSTAEMDFAVLKKPGFAFDLNFSAKPERIYQDFRKTPEGRIDLLFSCADISVFQNLTIHSRKDGDWAAVNVVAVNDGGTQVSLRFSLPAGTDGMRISFWRNGIESNFKAELKSVKTARPAIGVFEKPGDWLCGAASRKVQNALFRGGYDSGSFDAVADAADYKVVVLPYQPSLTGDEEKKLVRFVRRGGKLICFYQGAATLARAAGISVLPYRVAESGVLWTDLQTGAYSVPASTANLIPAEPLAGKPIAFWNDNQGRQTDIPACAVTDSAAWFAHLPPLPGAAAVDLYGSILQGWGVQPNRKRTFGTVQAQAIYPDRTGIWFHHPESRHPGGWAGLIDGLPTNITDIFVQLQAGGSVFFPLKGRDVVPANIPNRAADTLPALLASVSNRAIRVHAWITCFSMEGGDAVQIVQLKAAGRLLPIQQPWLDPSKEINRELVLDGIKALVYRGVNGIHLDYVRCPSACSEKERREISAFVKTVSETVRRINPACSVSAAVFPAPETAKELGQDWLAWIASGWLDFACPMTYSDSAPGFGRLLDLSLVAAPSGKIWAGIGYAADESQLDSEGIGKQFQEALLRKTGGVVIFAGNSRLVRELPIPMHKAGGNRL